MEHGATVGARYPRTMYKWDGKQLHKANPNQKPLKDGKKIIVKLYDAFLGFGDMVLRKGAEPPAGGPREAEVEYFADFKDLERKLRANKVYEGRAAFAAEFLEAEPRFGVNQCD